MFIVLEFQTNNNSTAIVPPIQKATLNEAEAAWHQILAAAAVSNVEKHTAMIVDDEGIVFGYKCYQHPVANNNEE